MSVRIDPTDLAGVTEIAEMLGVLPSAVVNWRYRRIGFPEPIATLKCGPLYLKSQVAAWSELRQGADHVPGN